MANKKTGGTRLTGLNPLAYLGVEPTSPPELVRYERQPTNRDFGFNIGDLWLVKSPFEVWMLLEKPQNVAFWALLYPQGGGGGGGINLIHTNTTNVIGDLNGEIGIVGGDNINIGANGPNEVVVNLNNWIEWPQTNLAGDEGIIYLGGDSFMHAYGFNGIVDANTYVGQLAGSFTATASSVSNSGFGAFTLNELTTAELNTAVGAAALQHNQIGDNNTAVGAFALTTLDSGDNNIALGYQAGVSLNGFDSNNICIGNEGTAGDSGITRIGTDGTQVETHVAAVHNTIVAGTPNPNMVVNVDDTGQLGQVELTSSGATIAITQPSNGVINLEAIGGGGGGGGGNPFAFSYVQVTDTTPIAFASLPYFMGSQVVMTQLFDVGGNFFPGTGGGGPGSESVYTAPVTGKYYFEWLSYNKAGGVGATIVLSIITTIRTYTRTFLIPTQSLSASPRALASIYTLVTDMNMGDEARFTASSTNAASLQVLGEQVPGTVAEGPQLNSTRISGFLIPEGASGGNFSQPFLGIQQVDATNVTGDGTVYLLGSAAPIVEQFDVGNNFSPGNGAGIPATFTAPATGKYMFNVFYIRGSVSSTITTQTGYMLINGVIDPRYYASSFTLSHGLSSFPPVALNVGDVVTFSFVYRLSPPALIVSLLATSTSFGLIENTYISGYRIG